MLIKKRLERLLNKIVSYENLGDMGGGWGTGQGSSSPGDSGDNIGGIDGWSGHETSIGPAPGAEHDSWGQGTNAPGGKVADNYGQPGTGTGKDHRSSERVEVIRADMMNRLTEDPIATIAMFAFPFGKSLTDVGARGSAYAQAAGYHPGPFSKTADEENALASAEAFGRAEKLGGYDEDLGRSINRQVTPIEENINSSSNQQPGILARTGKKLTSYTRSNPYV